MEEPVQFCETCMFFFPFGEQTEESCVENGEEKERDVANTFCDVVVYAGPFTIGCVDSIELETKSRKTNSVQSEPGSIRLSDHCSFPTQRSNNHVFHTYLCNKD